MKIIALLVVLAWAGAAEQPVFTAQDLTASEYVLDDGLVVANALLFQRTIAGRTWSSVASTGINFTFAADAEGNIEFTWDKLLYAAQIPTSFIVFYKKPTLGLRWNPDGVEIRIEKLDVMTKDLDGEHLTDVYGFYAKDALSARAWVSRTSGIVKIMRLDGGRERMLTRRRKTG